MTSKFAIGQKVKANAFTDCFGKEVPERSGLTVTEIRLMPETSIPAYFRIKAAGPDGLDWVEAAERFFAPELDHDRIIYVESLPAGVPDIGSRFGNHLEFETAAPSWHPEADHTDCNCPMQHHYYHGAKCVPDLTPDSIKAINEYLRDMAIAGYVPVPETIEEIKRRYAA